MNDQIDVKNEDVKGIKLKEYLDTTINNISNDLIEIAKSDRIMYSKDELFVKLEKYRDDFLSIKKICKSRNKF